MGETALTSQLKEKKHQEISKFFCTNPITSLLKKPNETESKSQDDMPQTSKKQVSIDNLVVSNATNKTEIRWVLNMVCSEYLKNFSSNVIRLFAAMFPDGEIAKNFQRQEKENERKSLKWKIVDDEIKQIKAKYHILQGEIEDLTISADKLALKAEKLWSCSLLP